ncbi:NTP transferase domain-containing protein [Galbibacter sp. EGI 63066]|uniref:NTP transferase domain-containing protein n=1 Tax=Galbibacter sp. EGI 63066 TaxID=2993559 RepID=UPI002249647E|nr:NTP transferase domain-containing protein [Galbibacter sp. EGI 63066]MCX2679938.1 NTP transferase domain-containing protein [Galbibacter sp. EGI 63066]
MTSADKLYGLVLCGGKSTRMGSDKSLIAYHGIPQRIHLCQLLEKACDKVFMSIRKDQKGEFSDTSNFIVDQDIHKGPYNGLLSAHEYDKNVAWLVLACDLPLIDEEAIQALVKKRDRQRYATAYALLSRKLPEPLCAIWESKALAESKCRLAEGKGFGPRKFLLDHGVKMIYPKRSSVLMNANSAEEYNEAIQKLKIVENK